MVNRMGADTPRWPERLAELLGDLLAGSFGSSESDPPVGGGGFLYKRRPVPLDSCEKRGCLLPGIRLF